MGEAIMSKAITKEDMALLKEASEMFNETGEHYSKPSCCL
jgi:hypothetical protein